MIVILEPAMAIWVVTKVKAQPPVAPETVARMLPSADCTNERRSPIASAWLGIAPTNAIRMMDAILPEPMLSNC